MGLLSRLQRKLPAVNRPPTSAQVYRPTVQEQAHVQSSIGLQPVSTNQVPLASDDLIPALVGYDRISESNRMGRQADSGMLNLSSLPDICPRAIAIARSQGNLFTEHKSVSPNDRIVWEMGRAAEKRVRDRLIETMGVGRVLGRWTCPCDAEDHYYDVDDGWNERELPTGHHYVPCGCGRKEISVYNEMDLMDADFGIIGHPDLPYWDSNGQVVVTEIKSIKGDDFKDLPKGAVSSAPYHLREMIGRHTFQAMGYRRMLEKAGYPVANYVRILYVSKNYLREMPYKEYPILSTNMTEQRLDHEWAKAAAYKEARRIGVMPDKLPACNAIDAVRAKSCPVVVSCFSRSQ